MVDNSRIFDAYREGASVGAQDLANDHSLPKQITRAASKQTHYTIRFLVDRNRVLNAYRAYAYFRWVDDWLDKMDMDTADRGAFMTRQQDIVARAYAGDMIADLTAEERIVVDLIHSDPIPNGGLYAYIQHMMAVMAFDTERRGRLISEHELTDYSHDLAVAVTEALHYFIGHDDPTPHTADRYLAVTSAHITHMLRDTVEDVAAGYLNIPREFLEQYDLDPCDVTSTAYKEWVRQRTQLARDYSRIGKGYLAKIRSVRCRSAGYAYAARFEAVLNAIEHEGYQLRAAYGERKTLKGGLMLSGSILTSILFSLTRGHA